MIKFVDLVHVQFLNIGCKNKYKNHNDHFYFYFLFFLFYENQKGHTMNYQKSIILWDKKYTNT